MPLIQLFSHATVGNDTRTEQMDGRTWLVAPAVIIVEGVLNGLYVPADEIAISTQSWNGRPVPVHHPVDTANNPQTVQNQVIGYFYFAAFNEDRLSGEMWLDIAKAQKLGGEASAVVASIQNGIMIEVSTAYWAYTISQKGEFKGKAYEGITTHILPDHVAVLPGEEGACNIKDGCGVPRTNSQEKHMKHITFNGKQIELMELGDRELNNHLTKNVEGLSFRDVGRALRTAIASVTQIASDHWIWVEDIYDDYVVYEIEAENSDMAGLWHRDYTIDSSMAVTLSEARPVVRRTVYEDAPQQQNILSQVKNLVRKLFDTHKKETIMNEMIDAIVANGTTGMTEEQLSALPETAISAIHAGLQLNEGDTGDDEPEPAPVSDMPDWAKTLADSVGSLATKVDELTASTNQAQQHEIDQLVKGLLANQRNTFSEDDLRAFSLPQLKKLSAALIEPDFSGLVYGGNDGGEYEYAPIVINTNEEVSDDGK